MRQALDGGDYDYEDRTAGHAGGCSSGLAVFGENQEYVLPRPRGLLWGCCSLEFSKVSPGTSSLVRAVTRISQSHIGFPECMPHLLQVRVDKGWHHCWMEVEQTVLPSVGNSQAQVLYRRQIDVFVPCHPPPPQCENCWLALSFCYSGCRVHGRWREGLLWVSTLGLLCCVCVVEVRCKPQEVFLVGTVLVCEDVADVCLGPDVFRP